MVSRSRGIRPLSRAGGGVLVADLVERLRARRPLKWGTACQQVVQERAQGMDIGGGTDRAGKGGHLLGGHVGRSPLGAVRAGLGRARLAFEAGDAEIGNLGGDDFPGGSRLAVEQDVRRFQIEVKNPAGVEVADGAGDRFRESGGIPRRERLRQSILERPPRHIFNDEPQPFLGLVHAMDGHDMVVRHPRERPRFTEPVLASVRIDQRVTGKQLHGDVAIQRGFPGEVNHARSAPAKLALDDETGKRWQGCSEPARGGSLAGQLSSRLQGSAGNRDSARHVPPDPRRWPRRRPRSRSIGGSLPGGSSSWSRWPRVGVRIHQFGETAVSLLGKPIDHALVGGMRGKVGHVQGVGRLARGPAIDGDVPEHLPGLGMDLLADGGLNLFRQVQQEQPPGCRFVVFLVELAGSEERIFGINAQDHRASGRRGPPGSARGSHRQPPVEASAEPPRNLRLGS